MVMKKKEKITIMSLHFFEYEINMTRNLELTIPESVELCYRTPKKIALN